MKEYIKPELKEIDIVVEGIYASGISGAEEKQADNSSVIVCPLCKKKSKPGDPLTAQHKGWCSLFPR